MTTTKEQFGEAFRLRVTEIREKIRKAYPDGRVAIDAVDPDPLTVDERCVLTIAHAMDVLYPPDDPDQSWRSDTIEWVAGVLTSFETGQRFDDCEICDAENVLLPPELSDGTSACDDCRSDVEKEAVANA